MIDLAMVVRVVVRVGIRGKQVNYYIKGQPTSRQPHPTLKSHAHIIISEHQSAFTILATDGKSMKADMLMFLLR